MLTFAAAIHTFERRKDSMKDFRVADRHAPVLPLDGQILFPLATVVLRLRKEGADRILEAATINQNLVVILQKKPDGEVHRIGTLAEVESSRSGGSGWDVTVRGLAKIRVESFRDDGHLQIAAYEFDDEAQDLDEATGQVLHILLSCHLPRLPIMHCA